MITRVKILGQIHGTLLALRLSKFECYLAKYIIFGNVIVDTHILGPLQTHRVRTCMVVDVVWRLLVNSLVTERQLVYHTLLLHTEQSE